MYQNYEVCYYVQELGKIIEKQNEHIGELEKEIKGILKDIESLKKNKQFTIEKIEYNFDQLKVETLSGTLNIGITSGGSGSIEELDVEGEVKEDFNFPKTKLHIGILNNIVEQIENYLSTGATDEIDILEQKYNKTIETEKKDRIIDDIRRQTEKQINAYINQKKDLITPENTESVENDIIKKVIEDINKALDSFIKLLPEEIN